MQVIFKGLNGLEVDADLKDYAKKKILKFDGFLEEPVVAEIVFSDLNGQERRGNDRAVHVTIEAAGLKQPLYAEEVTDDFKVSVDLIQEAIGQQILKIKGKRDEVRTNLP